MYNFHSHKVITFNFRLLVRPGSLRGALTHASTHALTHQGELVIWQCFEKMARLDPLRRAIARSPTGNQTARPVGSDIFVTSLSIKSLALAITFFLSKCFM